MNAIMSQHTPGPWHWSGSSAGYGSLVSDSGVEVLADIDYEGLNLHGDDKEADACLIAAAPTLFSEMCRYLPVLERAESEPEIWSKLTEGLGVATLNGYRAAIAKVVGETDGR